MNPTPYILVIDDENHICESCDRIFSKAGYKVDTNINATSGFRQALTNPYDAIILDLNLVESDGMTLLYGIRKRKPDVPVVIITGYPSEDTRRISSTMGVTDYITKPFEPAELLEPVQRIMTSENVYFTETETRAGEEIREHNYHFYHSSWFYQLEQGVVRAGGYLPNLSNCFIKSIKLAEPGTEVFRGLPLAEVSLSDGTRQIIPSPISGRVNMTNGQLKDHFYNLERNIHNKNWIAVVEPFNLKQDLKASETRRILVFSGTDSEENEFHRKFARKGYNTIISGNIDQVLNVLSTEAIQVILLDARQFGEDGPGYVRTINQEYPEVRIIVCSEPDVKLERQYRKTGVFYYGVIPISNNEMIDILHCAFTDGKTKISLRNPHTSSFLPNRIDKISVTNKDGIKVALFAYNEILQHSGGLGYLLTKELLERSFPVDIHHSRYRKLMDLRDENPDNDKSTVFEKNDRVIILQSSDFGGIPGSIMKKVQQYTNQKSALNLLIHIFIQPQPGKTGRTEFDVNTTVALKNLILSEMTSNS